MNKICICRNCNYEFTVTKPMPYCCATCRITHKAQQKTIHEGVNNDNSSNKDIQ